jgi:hypothetical protein
MLTNLYVLQSRARTVHMRIALTTTKKLHISVTDYYAKMCQLADELAATRAPLHDDELVTYILDSLDKDYNVVFTAVDARTDPIPPSELYTQLSFKQHTSLQAHHSLGGSSSAMASTCDRSSSGGHGYVGSDRGRSRGCSHGQSNRGSYSNNYSKNSHGSAS